MRNKFLKSNIIRMGMASFLILILFIAVSMLVGYGSTEQKLKAEMEQTNKAFMGERMRYIDSYVNNIVVGMMNISRLSDFDKISSVENFSGTGRSYDVRKFNEGMDSVEIEGVITEQRFVYLPQNNCIIGNGVARKPRDYFDIIGIRGDYEKWENSVLNTESKDMLCYGKDFDLYSTKNGMLSKTMFEMQDKPMFREEINSFLNCIESGERLPSHIDTNIITAKMMDAIYRSAQEHKEVAL